MSEHVDMQGAVIDVGDTVAFNLWGSDGEATLTVGKITRFERSSVGNMWAHVIYDNYTHGPSEYTARVEGTVKVSS